MTRLPALLALFLAVGAVPSQAQFEDPRTDKPWEPPSFQERLKGKPLARMRIIGAHPDGVTVKYLMEGSCNPVHQATVASVVGTRPPIFGSRETKRESIGMPAADVPADTSYTESPIPAGEPLHLEVLNRGGTLSCSMQLRFVPETGADYQLNFVEGPREKGRDTCRTSIERIVAGPAGSPTLQRVAVEAVRCTPRRGLSQAPHPPSS